jgi:hypothetical protein
MSLNLSSHFEHEPFHGDLQLHEKAFLTSALSFRRMKSVPPLPQTLCDTAITFSISFSFGLLI